MPEPVTSPVELLGTDFLATVSSGPGIYQMLDDTAVLYVGKAVNLRKRLASYRRYLGDTQTKTGIMLSRIRRIETILTATEKEALILEASLIKKHRPRYNVILRDDKNYPLIKVTVRDEWPRIVVTRKRLRDGSRYFGPYASTSSMRRTLKLLRDHFPLRRCRHVRKRSRPCLNHQLGLCLAPCAREVDRNRYDELVRGVLMVLEGRNRELLKSLREEMNIAARNLAFEKAARIRDLITGLTRTVEKQVVASSEACDLDVFGLVQEDISTGITVLSVRSGLVSGARTFFLRSPLGSRNAILAQAILQYYSSELPPPAELLLPFQPRDRELVREHLSDLGNGRVKLTVPMRGRRVRLVDMARRNSRQIFKEKENLGKSWQALAEATRKALCLRRDPATIVCIDISNIGGKQATGSLVTFVNGEKHTEGYRRYRIQTISGPDDYGMMREVLERWLARAREKGDLPDLLLLDGGRGQLNVAVDVIREMGLAEQTEPAALAKDKNNKGERVFIPGRSKPVRLPSHSPVLLFLMRVRDEAHRFGITHHRSLRRSATLRSKLDQLPDIGPRRRRLLLKEFGSVKRIRAATVEELQKVPGIGPVLAASIHRELHGLQQVRAQHETR